MAEKVISKVVINGKGDLSKLENLFLFGTKVGGEETKSPENVLAHPAGKKHTKQKSNPTVSYTLGIETLTAANSLIGCLETRKQETFSHHCQD